MLHSFNYEKRYYVMSYFYIDFDIVTILGSILNIVCYGAIIFLIYNHVKKSKAKNKSEKGQD